MLGPSVLYCLLLWVGLLRVRSEMCFTEGYAVVSEAVCLCSLYLLCLESLDTPGFVRKFMRIRTGREFLAVWHTEKRIEGLGIFFL